MDPDVVRKIVRDNGFTPKTADVRVTGRLADRDGKLVLSVNGPDVVYVLAEDPDAPPRLEDDVAMAMGAELSVTGRLPEIAGTDEEPRTLQLQEWRRLAHWGLRGCRRASLLLAMPRTVRSWSLD